MPIVVQQTPVGEIRSQAQRAGRGDRLQRQFANELDAAGNRRADASLALAQRNQGFREQLAVAELERQRSLDEERSVIQAIESDRLERELQRRINLDDQNILISEETFRERVRQFDLLREDEIKQLKNTQEFQERMSEASQRFQAQQGQEGQDFALKTLDRRQEDELERITLREMFADSQVQAQLDQRSQEQQRISDMNARLIDTAANAGRIDPKDMGRFDIIAESGVLPSQMDAFISQVEQERIGNALSGERMLNSMTEAALESRVDAIDRQIKALSMTKSAGGAANNKIAALGLEIRAARQLQGMIKPPEFSGTVEDFDNATGRLGSDESMAGRFLAIAKEEYKASIRTAVLDGLAAAAQANNLLPPNASQIDAALENAAVANAGRVREMAIRLADRAGWVWSRQ